MAKISAKQVKELREMTGAGMMDCKKALTQTDGDMDAAVEYLRENGLAKAAKKASRIAAEGIVTTVVSEDGKKAAIVNTTATDIDAFLAEPSQAEEGKTVKEALDGKIAIIGENLKIRRFDQVES